MTNEIKKNYNELISKANEAVRSANAEASKSPYRLAYHIAAPANWINDPNGLIQYKGEYHVFYQHHPYSAQWGPMHWGHVKSKDLVHWEHLPIALAPSEEYDRDGCFSGSAVDDNGTLTVIYTGHTWIDREKDEVEQVQCIATSTDGIHFSKDASNPVIPHPPKEGSRHFRDPKVWKHEGIWYMVLGTRKEDTGKVVLYKSRDLRSWSYVGVMAQSDGTLGYMWECPDLFSLGGKDILVFSPQGIEPQGDKYQNLYQTGYLVGKLDYETGVFEHGEFEELDKGFDFYAAQTFMDDQGRRILIGWMDMWGAPMPTQAHGWAGALTIPRELKLNENGKLLMSPVPELKKLRKKHIHFQPALLSSQQKIGKLGDCLEILIEFSLESCEASEFGIKVRCSDDGKEETVISYDVQNSVVSLDRNRSGLGVNGIRRSPLDLIGNSVKFHLYLDRSSLELFVNDGELTMSSRIYPDPNSLGIQVFVKDGSVKIHSFDIWELKEIW
jgi:beta-fructofuranosidase